MTKILNSFTLDVKQDSEYWYPILTNMNKETMQKRFSLFAIEEIKKSLSISATHVNQFSFDSLIEDFNKDSMVKITSNDINSDLFLEAISENFKGCCVSSDTSSKLGAILDAPYNKAINRASEEIFDYCFSCDNEIFMNNYVGLSDKNGFVSSVSMESFLTSYSTLPINTSFSLSVDKATNVICQFYILPDTIKELEKTAPQYVQNFIANDKDLLSFDKDNELGLVDFYDSNGNKRSEKQIFFLKGLVDKPFLQLLEKDSFKKNFRVINIREEYDSHIKV